MRQVGRAAIVVTQRRWLAGGLLCCVGVLALARGWPFTYPDDLLRTGSPTFYRLDVRGPGRLLSKPIFVKRS
jgi:hypothetical protein